MDITHSKPLTHNAYTMLRQAGYVPIIDRSSGGKRSYVLRAQQNRYPRYHLYVEAESDNETVLHLHIDKRQHGHGSRHDTDYNSEDVKKEAERLKRWLEHFSKKGI